MNVMNVGGVHDNGEPRLQIGMGKNNGFVIEYNTDLGMVIVSDATSGAILPILGPNQSPYVFKGQYVSYSALQTAVANGTLAPENGDCYNIINAGGTDSNGTPITNLCTVAYGNGNWFIVTK